MQMEFLLVKIKHLLVINKAKNNRDREFYWI